jgi:hypothetical protein
VGRGRRRPNRLAVALFIQVLEGETSETADLVLVIDDADVVRDLGRSVAARLGVLPLVLTDGAEREQ